MKLVNMFSRFCLFAIFAFAIFSTSAFAQKPVTFHAKFVANVSELHVSIPSDLIEPTIKGHYSYLADRNLSQAEVNLYLEMYLRETVKLQYGAFPMALGESGISHQNGETKLVMNLAGLPAEAKELMVQINSFTQHPNQQNLFKITKSFYKQSFALSNANAFSTHVPL